MGLITEVFIEAFESLMLFHWLHFALVTKSQPETRAQRVYGRIKFDSLHELSVLSTSWLKYYE